MEVIKIFLLSFLIVLVKSNPLGQRYYIQRNPQTFLQGNVPIEIPLVVDPSSNTCPCTQTVTAQNQITQPSPINIANTRLNELLYNNVVLNPNLQAILSSKSPQNNVVLKSSSAQTTVPKIINNYIILPVEFLENSLKDKRDTHESNGERKKATKKNKSKNSSKENEESSVHRRKPKTKATKRDDVENESTKELSKKTSDQNQHFNEFKNENERTKKFYNKSDIEKYNKNKDKQQFTNNLPENDNQDVIDMIEKLTNNKIYKRVKLSNEFNDMSDSRNESMRVNNQLHQNGLTGANRNFGIFIDPRTINSVNSNNNFPSENYKDEILVKDLQEKFPNVPEGLIKTLISYLKQQFRENSPNNFNRNFNYPTLYDQIFKSQFPFYGYNFNPFNQNSWNLLNHSQKRKRRPQKNKSNRSKEEKILNNTETTTSSRKVNEEANTYTVPVDIKPKIDQQNTVNQEVKILKEKVTDNIPVKYISDKKVDSDAHLINDYYPDFTADNTYFINTQESPMSDVHDRYIYSTDISNSELNRERRKFEQNSYNSSETNDPKINNNGQIKVSNMMSPKEAETKQTEHSLYGNYYERNDNLHSKNELNKISSDTHVKTQHISRSKNSGCTKNKNNKHADIETVYANSKVVKYGPTTEYVEVKRPDDDTTYVIARSFPSEEW